MGALGVFSVVCYGTAVIGSLALFVAPFTQTSRRGPRWTRIALRISGPMAASWGALGLTLMFAGPLFSREVYRAVAHLQTLFGGSGAGILILLFASGEFIPALLHRGGGKAP